MLCIVANISETKSANHHFEKELNETLAQVKNSGLNFTKEISSSSHQMIQCCSGSHLKQYQQKHGRSKISAFLPPPKKITVAIKRTYLIYMMLAILPHGQSITKALPVDLQQFLVRKLPHLPVPFITLLAKVVE